MPWGSDRMSRRQTNQSGRSLAANEVPEGLSTERNAEWGSDVIAEMLRLLDLDYLCVNPGASFRGLHDSLVNHLGNENPRMLVALHEEHCIAIAHGYAKASGRMMGAVVHSNVGLMHATMGIFDAWCDRMPVFVLGATGPVDADRRRPWIDWIHTARDQGALVRSYTKWDDQPASVPAAVEAMMRAAQIARSSPQGPVYVNLDVSLQEDRLASQWVKPKIERFAVPPAPAPDPAALDQALAALQSASNPLILMGRVSKTDEDWARRIRLAEQLGARVITDVKPGIAFPLDHPLQTTRPSTVLVPQSIDLLRASDVVLSLDWVDLAGTLKMAWPDGDPPCRVISVSMDRYVHNGWSMDHQGLPAVDVELITTPDRAVAAMGDRLNADGIEPVLPKGSGASLEPVAAQGDQISLPMLASALRQAADQRPISLLRVPISWDARYWPPTHPLDHLGSDGGGGIGSGPGMAIGSALALMGGGRLPVAILGDGDFLMGSNALWTATHYGIPLLIVLYNNRTYLQDEMHQERVAITRGRPVENRWIGLRLTEPEVDLAAMARSQGAIGYGPVREGDALADVFAQAIIDVDDGATVVVDVHCTTDYFGNTTNRA